MVHGMKSIKILMVAVLSLVFAAAYAAPTFNYYGPVSGLQANSGTSGFNRAATATDTANTYAGQSGCTGSAALLFNATCAPISSGCTFANPSALIGLTAINGTATTCLRSDAAQAWDQSISPTLTGQWIFNGASSHSSTTSGVTLGNDSGSPALNMIGSGGGTNAKIWRFVYTPGSNILECEAVNDAFSVADDWCTVTRAGNAIATIGLGNSTDKPPITLNGPVIIPDPGTGKQALTLTQNGATTGMIINGSASGGIQEQITGGSNEPADLVLKDGQSGTVSWTLSAGDVLAGTFSIRNGARGLAITSGGNFSLAAPNAGIGLTALGVSGAAVAQFKTGANTATDLAIDLRNSSNTQEFKVDGTGAVFMPNIASSTAAQTGTVCFTTGGNLTFDPTNTCLISSIRYKKNVEPLEYGLAQVMQLRPVTYELRDEMNPGHMGRQDGFIAEEVQKIDARLTPLDGDGLPRSVEYGQMTALLTRGIQDMEVQIWELRAAVALLAMWSLYLTASRRRHG